LRDRTNDELRTTHEWSRTRAKTLLERMDKMTLQLQANGFDGDWKGIKLPAVLVGDVAAAGIAATLISPVITAIDR
jgi:hypothetical protein